MSRSERQAAVAAIIAIIVVAGEAFAGAKPSIVAPDDLRARSDQMCAALKSKDARALYELRTPDFRTCNTYEALLDEFRRSGEGRVVSCKATKIEPAKPADIAHLEGQCSKELLALESAAVITLRIKMVEPNGRSNVINDMLNGWVRLEGTWYWYDWSSPSID